ncbi:DUF1127 domain-containing protein [Roseobacter denitrificans]|nr:DUF1127 domain-containing protein [Roseobacter denitrificans]AVL54594.1 DUF1127 domain-containing protein [Roseobacter denitrificans]SFF89343.1 protein of unknown function [Roseobacter denitrificans OCh 114]
MALSNLGTLLGTRGAGSVQLALSTRLALWKSRRALAKLDDRALNDVGISRAEADREAQLTVWDVPAAWKRC